MNNLHQQIVILSITVLHKTNAKLVNYNKL